jgi:hypothetical protein
MKDYKWRPIEDLPEHWPELAAPELPALSAAWQKYAEFLGLMAVSAWITLPKLGQSAIPLSKTPFQFSLQDDESQVTQRLDKWLDEQLLAGLDLWRKQL